MKTQKMKRNKSSKITNTRSLTGSGGGRKRKTHKKTSTDKSHKTDNHYKKVNCSPNPNKSEFSCYTNDALFKMKTYWNARHQRDQISTNEPKKIWLELRENMGNSCDRESCWLRSKFMEGKVDNELLNYTFAPKSPDEWKRKPNEWLSSLDIESVMKQYEKYYRCFEFLGPSPIDYDHHKLYGECVWEELCHLNLSKMIKRNKNKLGIIFNTDPHYKNGEHWISMFVNIKKKFIVYFDSNGNEPPKQVKKLIHTIEKQGKQLGIDFKVHINKREHQKTDSECGMYSLYFIIQMLKDKDVTYFLENNIPDDEVYELRNKYFNMD
tara:strand:- start:669 stop:1637 length:969 start_codon:yes stop_codon:yes gene_type:complete